MVSAGGSNVTIVDNIYTTHFLSGDMVLFYQAARGGYPGFYEFDFILAVNSNTSWLLVNPLTHY